MALMHRYRNTRQGTRFEALFGLLDEAKQTQAEILGKAMRLGAMLWMQKDAPMGRLDWFPKKRRLDLTLSPEASPLYGEVAEARLHSLAQVLDATVGVHLPGRK